MIRQRIKEILWDIHYHIAQGEFFSFDLPSLSDKNVILEDNKFRLGERVVRRDFKNLSHIHRITQMIVVLRHVYHLVEQRKTTTKRGLYYTFVNFSLSSGEKLFESQDETDSILRDLEFLLRCSSDDFGIRATPRGRVYGDIEFRLPDGSLRSNLTPDGVMLSHYLASLPSSNLVTRADKVIAIESSGPYNRLVESGFCGEYDSLVVELKGIPSRSEVRFLSKLEQMGLEVFILTDGDVYGCHIYTVLRYGSPWTFHLENFTVPSVKWLGLYATDASEFNLPSKQMTSKVREKYREYCNRRLESDKRYKPFCEEREFIRDQVKLFRDHLISIDIQSLNAINLDFITSDFLPDRLEMM